MNIGPTVIQVVRTVRLETGWRSVWYLPGGQSVHAIEDNPILPGPYFLRPDETGRFQNWVIESDLNTRMVSHDGDSPDRFDVEVHAGNTMEASEGCFCPGVATNERGVAYSAIAIGTMRSALLRDDPEPPIWFINITEVG